MHTTRITLSCQFCEEHRNSPDDRFAGDIWETYCQKRGIWVRERYPICSEFHAYSRFYCKSLHDWISLKSCIRNIRDQRFDCMACPIKDMHLEARRQTFANMAVGTDGTVVRAKREVAPVVRLKRG